MAYCSNCGNQIVGSVKFCHECGCAIDNNATNPKRATVYAGRLIKCSNCGEIVNSFVQSCSSCGWEIRGAKVESVVADFAKQLYEIDNVGGRDKNNRKLSLIRNFVIPNSKEDLLEFIVLASANMLQMESSAKNINMQIAISDAWEAKLEQAYQKAKLTFGDKTEEFLWVDNLYKQKKKEKSGKLKKKKKEKWFSEYKMTFIGVFSFLGFAMLFAMIFIGDANLENENTRLEKVVVEIYEDIENEEYDIARAKTATLVCTGSSTAKGTQMREKWDKTRTELMQVIDRAEYGNDYESDYNNIIDESVEESEKDIFDHINKGLNDFTEFLQNIGR